MKKALIFSGLIFLFKTSAAQCEIVNKTFIYGEYLEFDVYYNFAFIPVKAAKVTFEVMPFDKTSKNIYKLKAEGKTLPAYKFLFDVVDIYECSVDKNNLKPLIFEKTKKEDSYKSYGKYVFDYQNNLINIEYKNSDGANTKLKLKNSSCARDILSTMYYARNLEFNFIKEQKIFFRIADETSITSIYGIYEGLQNIKVSGKKYSCHVFSSKLSPGTLFGNNGKLTVWVSNDANKIPVKVKADIIIGNVEVLLVRAKNLRY